jgi:hypothetical protein
LIKEFCLPFSEFSESESGKFLPGSPVLASWDRLIRQAVALVQAGKGNGLAGTGRLRHSNPEVNRNYLQDTHLGSLAGSLDV